MQSINISSIFKGFNGKIVFYFIAFAFVPLAIFSILGYYLNKNMISDINFNNLHSVNRQISLDVKNFLKYKTKLLQHSVHLCSDHEQFENSKNLYNCIESAFRIHEEFKGILIQNKSTWTNTLIPFESDSAKLINLPYVEFKHNTNLIIKGFIDVGEFKNIFNSDTSKIKHKIIFLKIKRSLSLDKYNFINYEDTLWNRYETDLNGYPKRIYNTDDSDEVFETYSKLPHMGIILISSKHTKYIYADLISFRDKIFFANIVLAIILIGLAFLYSRHITKPIHKLVEGVQQIRNGNLDYQIDIRSNDEIQMLAREFELMRLQLQESYQSFEKKIELRTRELQEAQSQISHQEKMASLGLMAAGIAHEIGNPLTSISSMAQVMKRRLKNQENTQFIDNILKNIDRISLIVRELVDFSRPSSYSASMTNINELINSAVGIVKYDQRSRHLQFDLELDRDLPKTYLVADHLLQVLINILINAVDASENYSNQINVASVYKNDQIEITIQDKGCGIPKEKLNKIFEPFFTTKDVGKGTGLGLTVSYGIVKKFGGEIKVESEIGQGSTFCIVLPVKTEEQFESEKK